MTLDQPPPIDAVVYRMYDADERLLYVGQSTRGLDRIQEHGRKEWWKDVDIVTVEHFGGDADAACQAEFDAIATEAPKFNRRTARQQNYTRRAGRCDPTRRDTSQQVRFIVQYGVTTVVVWALDASWAEQRVRRQVLNRFAASNEILHFPVVIEGEMQVREATAADLAEWDPAGAIDAVEAQSA